MPQRQDFFGGSEGTVGFIVIEPPIGVSIGMTTVATEPAMKGEVGIVKDCFAFLSQTLGRFWPESDGARDPDFRIHADGGDAPTAPIRDEGCARNRVIGQSDRALANPHP